MWFDGFATRDGRGARKGRIVKGEVKLYPEHFCVCRRPQRGGGSDINGSVFVVREMCSSLNISAKTVTSTASCLVIGEAGTLRHAILVIEEKSPNLQGNGSGCLSKFGGYVVGYADIGALVEKSTSSPTRVIDDDLDEEQCFITSKIR